MRLININCPNCGCKIHVESEQEKYNMNEWCYDCKEYDSEKHCCPRFNKVIEDTLEEMKNNQWIPVTERLPEIGEVVLVTTSWKTVKEAKFFGDYWRIGYIENNLPNVIAWMPIPPLPEPWNGRDSE